jgi:hypothetical protein
MAAEEYLSPGRPLDKRGNEIQGEPVHIPTAEEIYDGAPKNAGFTYYADQVGQALLGSDGTTTAHESEALMLLKGENREIESVADIQRLIDQVRSKFTG